MLVPIILYSDGKDLDFSKDCPRGSGLRSHRNTKEVMQLMVYL